MSQLRAQLDALVRFDMARVSAEQLEVLRRIVNEVPQPAHGVQVKLALIHHHLLLSERGALS